MIDIDFKFYRGILWKRLPLIIMIWLIISTIAIAVAYVLPPVYRSNARLLVVKPQIDQTTVTVTSAEIIQSIQERLLTRSNMLDIAKRFDIYGDQPDLSPSERYRDMFDATSFRVVDLGGPRNRAPSATAFIVSFSAENPQLALDVTNQLTTMILELNRTIRDGIAGNTATFYQQEVDRLSDSLADLEAQIVNFESENADSLPNSLDFRRSEMSRVQARLLAIDTEMQTLVDQKAQLERVINNPGSSPLPTARQSPEERQLLQLTGDLAKARTIYSDTHPNVLQLKAQIEVLENAIRGQVTSTDGTVSTAPTQLELQVQSIDALIRARQQERAQLEIQMAEIQTTIDQTPTVTMGLNALNRRYGALQSQYNTAVARLNTAATGESIEVRQQGERFEVIDQPTRADEPESPNRLFIAATGLVGGLAAGLGLVILLELLNKSVRRPSELVSALGIQPFATVPYIATQGEIMRRRLRMIAGLLTFAVGVPVLLYIIHYQYMPIDLIISKVVERFGLDDLMRNFG
jgi:polysaccharide chain length determinant protein (PEP-CTERM system associated)